MTTEASAPRELLVDALAVAAVGGLLVGIHVLVPAGLRNEFALLYGQPDPFHALSAAYVHLTDVHLVGNLKWLLAWGGLAIALSHLAGERRWFRLTWLWFLTVLPIAVGMTGAAIVGGPVTSRGFSSVVAALGGFGLVSVAVVLHRTFDVDRWLAWNVVAGLTIVVGAEILWLMTGAVSPAIGGLLALAFGLTLVPVARAGWRTGLPAERDGWWRLLGAFVTTGLLGAVVVVFVVGLFPAELVGEGSVTNILGHYLGLVYGAIIAGWGYRYWSVGPLEGRENRRS